VTTSLVDSFPPMELPVDSSSSSNTSTILDTRSSVDPMIINATNQPEHEPAWRQYSNLSTGNSGHVLYPEQMPPRSGSSMMVTGTQVRAHSRCGSVVEIPDYLYGSGQSATAASTDPLASSATLAPESSSAYLLDLSSRVRIAWWQH
jgi:hypothetical protein